MEPITLSTFLAAALGYLLKGAAQSKAANTAKEELLTRLWQWARPHFIKEVPEAETQPDAPKTEEKMEAKLLELLQDKAFFEALAQHIHALQQAGVKEKNIVRKDILRVKRIRIGDRMYTPDEPFDRKNIVEGRVEDADEFILGDGQ